MENPFEILDNVKLDKLKGPVLIIDGNYFGHRALHGLSKDDSRFTLDTQGDMIKFENALLQQLASVYNSFNNQYHTLVQNVIFTVDNSSWRKEVKPFRPYYIDEKDINTPIGYKENRKEAKEKSDINYDNLNFCVNNFAETIKDRIPVFNGQGFEGDDNMLMITKYLSKLGIKCIVFCTDGDMKQIVNDNVILYRNTKSKECPNGEVVVSANVYNKVFAQQSAAQAFLSSSFDKAFYGHLFNLQLNGGQQKSNANRQAGKDITIADPFVTGFVKVICGDKKDNIFPLFRWYKNNKAFSVTEKMLTSALKTLGYPLNDSTIVSILKDDELFLNTLLGIGSATGQLGIAKNLKAHFKHNYTINMLTTANMPERYKKIFDDLFIKNLSLIDNVFDVNTLMSSYKAGTLDSANILMTSIPDSDNLINDILNN